MSNDESTFHDGQIASTPAVDECGCGLWNCATCRLPGPDPVQAARVIAIGALVRDNDPREPRRVMRVHGFDKGRAILRMLDPECGAMCETRIALRRIHVDGKPRKSGWSVQQ